MPTRYQGQVLGFERPFIRGQFHSVSVSLSCLATTIRMQTGCRPRLPVWHLLVFKLVKNGMPRSVNLTSCRFAFPTSEALPTSPSESILESIPLSCAIVRSGASCVAVVVSAAAIADATLCMAIVLLRFEYRSVSNPSLAVQRRLKPRISFVDCINDIPMRR